MCTFCALTYTRRQSRDLHRPDELDYIVNKIRLIRESGYILSSLIAPSCIFYYRKHTFHRRRLMSIKSS